MTQLLAASSRTVCPSPVSTALESGAQKWDRDPFSENASVDRCVPAAIAVSVSLSPAAVSAATAA